MNEVVSHEKKRPDSIAIPDLTESSVLEENFFLNEIWQLSGMKIV